MLKRKIKFGLIAAFVGALVLSASVGFGSIQSVSANESTTITMQAGAEARLNTADGKNGIRFTTVLGQTWYNNLIKDATTVEVGTLIIPTDLMSDSIALINNEEAERVVYKSATVNNEFTETETTYTYSGAVVTIKDGNLMRPFTGVGYVLIDEGLESQAIHYATANDVSRSVMYVLSGQLALGTTNTYITEKINAATTRIDQHVTDAALQVKIGGETYKNGDTLTLSEAGTLAVSASYGGFDVISKATFTSDDTTLNVTQSQDFANLNVSGVGKGTLTFELGEKTASITVVCGDYSAYPILHNGNKAAFGFVESWAANFVASTLDITTTMVSEMNGIAGNYTKNEVTFNAKGNGKFKIAPTSFPMGTYAQYQALAQANPDLGVKLFIYMDGSNVKHPEGRITNLTNGAKSDMFDIASHTPKASGGIYTIEKTLSLSDWLAINYTQNKDDATQMDWAWKNILTVGGNDTIGAGSTLTCYISIDLVEIQPVDLTKGIAAEQATFALGNWGSSATDYTFTAEDVMEANGKTGSYVKYNFVQNSGKNNIVKLTNTPIISYEELSAAYAANNNLKAKLYVYVDGTNIAGTKYLSNTVTAPAFGVSSITPGNNKTYEYTTEMGLNDWLTLNYSDGIWQNKALFQGACSSGYTTGDSYCFYVSIVFAE